MTMGLSEGYTGRVQLQGTECKAQGLAGSICGLQGVPFPSQRSQVIFPFLCGLAQFQPPPFAAK